jgi:hypothetical protein
MNHIWNIKGEFSNNISSRWWWWCCSSHYGSVSQPFHRRGTLDLSLHISRYPLRKHLFFKLIYFLIISYVRDKVVYCGWVSIYALINDVILFVYLFIISTSRGIPRKCSRYPRVPRNPGWESLHYGVPYFAAFVECPPRKVKICC